MQQDICKRRNRPSWKPSRAFLQDANELPKLTMRSPGSHDNTRQKEALSYASKETTPTLKSNSNGLKEYPRPRNLEADTPNPGEDVEELGQTKNLQPSSATKEERLHDYTGFCGPQSFTKKEEGNSKRNCIRAGRSTATMKADPAWSRSSSSRRRSSLFSSSAWSVSLSRSTGEGRKCPFLVLGEPKGKRGLGALHGR